MSDSQLVSPSFPSQPIREQFVLSLGQEDALEQYGHRMKPWEVAKQSIVLLSFPYGQFMGHRAVCESGKSRLGTTSSQLGALEGPF